MLKNRIIPCLDVNNGRVVKGINFVDLKDAGDPVEQAEYYDKCGADEICFLDITATHENRNTIIDIVNKTAEKCFVPLTVGGGIKSIQNIRDLLLAGADKVSINSAAVNDITFIKEASKKFGTQCMVIAVDAKKVSENKWEIFTHGGRKKTGINAIDFAIQAEKNGAGEILLTSMDRDGTKSGYDLELLKRVTSKISIPVIASGGVGNLEHLKE
jgi:cyclase